MTDSPTMSAHGRRGTTTSGQVLPMIKRNPVKTTFAGLGVVTFIAAAVAFSTMNTDPYVMAPGDDLATITGSTKAALDIGEGWNRPVRVQSDGYYYTVDYKIARLLAGHTKKVGIIVIVPPGAEVKKTNWHWDYKPPLADR